MRGRRYPDRVQARAIALRTEGRSLGEISVILTIPKNTLSGWVRHVSLTAAQRQRLISKEITSAARGRPLAVEAWRKKIERWKETIRSQVDHLGALPFTQPSIGQLACGLLYICEGGKYPSTRHRSFGNTDPRMIRFFLLLLRRHLSLDEKKFRVRVMHRWDQDEEALQRFWSQETDIPLEQFYPARADSRTKGKPTQRTDYRGICNIMYFSTTLQYTLQAIGDSALNRAIGMEGRVALDDPGSGLLGEPEPPTYDTVYFSAFPERAEIRMVEQEGLEPSASCMPCKRSGQLSYCPANVSL